MTAIRLQGICKAFGRVPVLRGIDLEIAPGEFCVFVGPSGCGKSTLLRLIAGLEEPGAGEITMDGVLLNPLAPAERDVAMVFQSYALYPHMTAFENMAFGLRHRKLPAADITARVAQAAQLLNLQDLLQRRPRELSGGQRQRVAIGRAIVRQPRVFLFDEPLSNLDAELRVRMRLEIARLHRALPDISMLYVTHDQVEAMTLADRIVLLRPLAGEPEAASIAQVGTPLELYHHPANRFVAGFIGSPAMNFISARVAAMGDGWVDVVVAAQPEQPPWRVRGVASGALLQTGGPVTLGIRPEHVSLDPADAAGGHRHHARISHVERLGEMNHVVLELPGVDTPLLAKTRRDDLGLGATTGFSFDPAAMHLFDANGRALPRTA